jgi:hypothetical protein
LPDQQCKAEDGKRAEDNIQNHCPFLITMRRSRKHGISRMRRFQDCIPSFRPTRADAPKFRRTPGGSLNRFGSGRGIGPTNQRVSGVFRARITPGARETATIKNSQKNSTTHLT